MRELDGEGSTGGQAELFEVAAVHAHEGAAQRQLPSGQNIARIFGQLCALGEGHAQEAVGL